MGCRESVSPPGGGGEGARGTSHNSQVPGVCPGPEVQVVAVRDMSRCQPVGLTTWCQLTPHDQLVLRPRIDAEGRGLSARDSRAT